VRARGSDRIVWSEMVDTKAERKVRRLIKRVHGKFYTTKQQMWLRAGITWH